MKQIYIDAILLGRKRFFEKYGVIDTYESKTYRHVTGIVVLIIGYITALIAYFAGRAGL